MVTQRPRALRTPAPAVREPVHLCISWNSIDLDRDIEWTPGSTFELEWRRDALAAVEALRSSASPR